MLLLAAAASPACGKVTPYALAASADSGAVSADSRAVNADSGPVNSDMAADVAPPADALAIPPYNRDDWLPDWADDDGDCQNTRAEVLIRDADGPITLDAAGCVVTGGTWDDPYSGQVFTRTSDVQIDHMVPLANAHRSGGWAWPPEKKHAYANYLGNDYHLLAVSGVLNQDKSDSSPDMWKPPLESYWCTYARHWAQIKHDWQLAMTAAEAAAVEAMEASCPDGG